MDECPILFGIDSQYVDPLLVTLTSLVVDGGVDASNAVIYVMHCSLDDAAQRRIERTAAALELGLRLVRVEPDVHAYPVTDWITSASYLRLRMAEVLPDFHRALYLDCDLVTVGDIRELLTFEPPTPVAAVRDLSHPLVGSGNGLPGYEELGLPGEREYFNAGVLLVNLDLWKAEGVASRASQFLVEEAHHVRLWDQDALNFVIDDRWHRLPAEYNAVVMSPLMPMLEEHYLGGDVMPLSEALAVEKTARVLHYAGPFKPWSPAGYPDCDVGRTYDRYRTALRSFDAEPA